VTVDARAATTPGAARAWAEVEVDRIGRFRGELVGFDQRVAIIAFEGQADVPVGQRVRLSMGVEDEQAEQLTGKVLDRFEDRGRWCVAVELADDGPSGRKHTRVPFSERVEVIGITDRPGPDPRWRGVAFDISSQGLGVTLPSEIRLGALVLLRFSLPPHRAAFQVRATAQSCVRESADTFRTGFLFERVTAGHAQHIQAALLHLFRARQRAIVAEAAELS
jgi:hypothetical protein